MRSDKDAASHQQLLDSYFDEKTRMWSDIYTESDIHSVTHQVRLALALAWIESLSLPEGSRVLEVGCGTGLLAVSLAHAGLSVTATDTVPAMLEATRRRASEADVADKLEMRLADARALDMPDASFDLVIGLGVLGWLQQPAAAADSMARVLRPGGHVLANVDNLVRLTRMVDPLKNPLLRPLRGVAMNLLERVGLLRKTVRPRQFWWRSFDRLLRRAGLEIVRRGSYGFGPFTFFGLPLLTESAGMRLHRRLQLAADRGTRLVSRSGAQYIILARKPAPPSE